MSLCTLPNCPGLACGGNGPGCPIEPKNVLDVVSGFPCPNCGSTGWIIDTDGAGKYWLLCLGKGSVDCVETRALPENVRIIDG